jgi:hypothetical protein
LQYIWGAEDAHGIFEAFEGWVRAHQPPYESWEKENLTSLLAGFIDHYSGEYDVESGTSKAKGRLELPPRLAGPRRLSSLRDGYLTATGRAAVA